MLGLQPFFCYYGGKWRVAPHYPPPRCFNLIEPFAGAAGYSLRYPDQQVWLYDVDPIICGVWDYLIRTPTSEILRLPLAVSHVDDLKIPQEARWLIGFWLNKGCASPCKTPSLWMREGLRPNSFWGSVIRQRVADQQERIRHWRIFNTSFETIPDMRATWFVDPPYQNVVGRHYRYSTVDFTRLGEWCQSRDGQIIVCEQEGADWLPFTFFRSIKANEGGNGKSVSREMVWAA